MNKLQSIADDCWDNICKSVATVQIGQSDISYTGSNGNLRLKNGVAISPDLMKQCYLDNKDKICQCCKESGMKSCCSYIGNETLNFCGTPCDTDDGSYIFTPPKPDASSTGSTDGNVAEATMKAIIFTENGIDKSLLPEQWNLETYMTLRTFISYIVNKQIADPANLLYNNKQMSQEKIDCVLNKLVELFPNPKDIDFNKFLSILPDLYNNCDPTLKTDIPNRVLINNGVYPSEWNANFYDDYRSFLNFVVKMRDPYATDADISCLENNLIVISKPNAMTKNLIDIETLYNNCVKKEIKDPGKPNFANKIWMLFFIILILLSVLGWYIYNVYGKQRI